MWLKDLWWALLVCCGPDVGRFECYQEASNDREGRILKSMTEVPVLKRQSRVYFLPASVAGPKCLICCSITHCSFALDASGPMINTMTMKLSELFSDTTPFILAPRLIISIWDSHVKDDCVYVSTPFADNVCWTDSSSTRWSLTSR
ncbi:hypothetical protein DEU56DRAFT_215941 [Suillus clintonianus]|uniref:uncharacterized protein n=1 Tax=Suillus clintonianus TaxID=1904413 RepID=UPI001B8758CD|nr:uncharacterized protein DEU56DRAFT_215941 [Suillus clintonianus]KAG2111095.1 hypothetical protein DEU56DRAFT_215941 [Suillus clintonianus]